MKKRTVSLLFALLILLTGIIGVLPVSAAGTLSAKAGANSVLVGQSVTLTLTYSGGDAGIASIDMNVTYDAAVFQFVSCTGNNMSANAGTGGMVHVSYFSLSAVAEKTAQMQLTFKAVAAGNGAFTATTTDFINDADYSSLGNPTQKLTVGVTNPTLSANADLASLKLSAGTLSPAFAAKQTNYTATVPYGTTAVSVSVTAADKNAKVAIDGKDALQVGKNTRTVTVTAPAGNTKKYTVVITRAANQTTAPRVTTAPTTTTTAPTEPPIEVTVDGVKMAASRGIPAEAALPDGFVWKNTQIGAEEIPAAVREDTGLTLVWLTEAAPPEGATPAAGFYLYDGAAFSPYRTVTVPGGVYTVRDLPEDLALPYGTVRSEAVIAFASNTDGGEAEAPAATSVKAQGAVYEDATLADFILLYATDAKGNTGLYVYDKAVGTMSRYYLQPADISDNEDEEVDTEPEEPTGWDAINAFFEKNGRMILLITVAVAALALLIVAIVLLIRTLGKRPRGRH